MVYMKFGNCRRRAAMTLPEVLIALLLLGLFLPSVFAINSVCLRLVNATKESTAALQSVHDRCETLRNLAFTDLTAVTFMPTFTMSGSVAARAGTSLYGTAYVRNTRPR